jgi:DNA-binding MarR family transcriptional regulator
MAQHEYIGHLIWMTHKALKKKMTTSLSGFGITVQQFGVLSRLFYEDGLASHELVSRLSSDRSTIMAIIDRLEEKGLVNREQDPRDRRVNHIYLTEKAKKLRPKLTAIADRVQEEMLRGLRPGEIRTFLTCLDKFHRSADVDKESSHDGPSD